MKGTDSFSTLDEKLFFSSRYNPKYNPNQELDRLLPQLKNTSHNLRQHMHNLTVPMDVSAVIKQNFVHRMLFRDIY